MDWIDWFSIVLRFEQQKMVKVQGQFNIFQPKNQSCVHLVCSRPTSHALQILRALLSGSPKDIRLRKDSVSAFPSNHSFLKCAAALFKNPFFQGRKHYGNNTQSGHLLLFLAVHKCTITVSSSRRATNTLVDIFQALLWPIFGTTKKQIHLKNLDFTLLLRFLTRLFNCMFQGIPLIAAQN